VPNLEQLGWVHKESKGQWDPSQVVKVLGLILNLVQGTIWIPKSKLL
jgi:hypothetical protein